MSAEEIFVASCLFICDKHYSQTILDWVELRCMGAIGAGFELKNLLKQACDAVIVDDSS